MKLGSKTVMLLGVGLVALFVMLPAAGASRSERDEFLVSNATGCGVTDGIVLAFTGEFIRSDDRTGKANRGNHYIRIDTHIPAGNYDITLQSFDDHSTDGGHPEQTHEQWHIIFRSGDQVVATSNRIADLADHLDYLTQQVNSALSIPQDVDNILAYHPFYLHPEHGKNINSIHPQCAGIKLSSPPKAAIGDYVWLDNNRNGLQDGNEIGVPTVPVHLYDGFGAYLKTTWTDDNGRYHFTELDPGDYAIQVDPPAGYIITGQNLGDDHFDSDIDLNGRMATTTLVANENDLSWDAGLYLPPPPPRVEPRLQAHTVQVVCNDGDAQLPNVNAVLYYNNQPLESRDIDFNGQVEFSSITISDEAAGQRGQIAGWDFTSSYKPDLFEVEIIIPTRKFRLGINESIQNDPNSARWQVRLPLTDCRLPQIRKAVIGDFVWLDWNQNDIQDEGESGVGDVLVILFDANLNEISRTTTNSDGRYLFDDLNPGEYSVQFFPPEGYTIVEQNEGTNSAIDSDMAHVDGRTVATTLDPFEVDLTWDAGLYRASKETSCARFDLDLGRNAQTGAGIAGRYEMIEFSTGKLLASWGAQDSWVDSGWIKGIILSHPESSWVSVYFHPDGDLPSQKLEILNPAPGTEFGWLSPGICHAIEVQFPAEW